MLRYGTVKRLIAKYAANGGLSPDSPDVHIFVRQVLQRLLFNGNYGSYRKFSFAAKNGYVTLPYDLETPIKVKVDNQPIVNVWNKWFEFYNYGNMDGYTPYEASFTEDPNYYSTIYEIPHGGSKIAAKAIMPEAPLAHVLVQGLDPTGREIYSFDPRGNRVRGIYLPLHYGKTIRSEIVIGKITSVLKTKTNGYVNLFSVIGNDQLSLLADYSPYEENPQYRRTFFKSPTSGTHKVSLVGKIRLKENYADEDMIPFENIDAIVLAAQSINSGAGNDINGAIGKNNFMQKLANNENEFKQTSTNQSVETFVPTSPRALNGVPGRNRGLAGRVKRFFSR